MSSSHSAINYCVINIILSLTIMGIQEHSVQRELRSNSLADIKKIEHLLNGLVSLLSHTSKFKEVKYLSFGLAVSLKKL